MVNVLLLGAGVSGGRSVLDRLIHVFVPVFGRAAKRLEQLFVVRCQVVRNGSCHETKQRTPRHRLR